MNWPAVIAAILEIVGPLVAEWLRRWLENRMRDAARVLPPPFAHTGKDAAMILRRVHDDIPWWNVFLFGRKRFVKALLDRVPTALHVGHGFLPDEEAAIKAAAQDA